MIEREIEGRTYRIYKMPVMVQWQVAKKLAPVVARMGPVLPEALGKGSMGDMVTALAPLAGAIADMPDADSDFVFDRTLRAVKVYEAGVESDFWNDKLRAPQYADVSLPTLLQLVMEVLGASLAGFTPGRAAQ